MQGKEGNIPLSSAVTCGGGISNKKAGERGTYNCHCHHGTSLPVVGGQ